MIWRIDRLPHGRVVGTCKTCGSSQAQPNMRAAEMWARDHDQRECARRARVQKAAQALTTAPRSDEGPNETPTLTHHHHAALTGAVTTSEEIAS